MALSGREVLLVLRARDEATRTISRVSGAMRRMDRDAITSSSNMINAQRDTLRRLQTQLGDVNHAYSQTQANALQRHRAEMRATGAQLAMLGQQRKQVMLTADEQARASSQMLRDGRITQAQFDEAANARRTYLASNLRGMDAEKAGIDEVRRTARGRYQEEIEGARRLHLEQTEGIRQNRIMAQDSIIHHQQRMDQMADERNRMRDRGSMMMGVGAGMMAAGVGMTYFGIQGVRAWASTTEAAVDYEQQARRTLTQVDNNHVALKKVADMGKEIGATVPVAFEQVQPALYDIFSSIDVGVKGAEKLLRQFAQDAVGGMTEMSVATRANLAIMNAWKLEVKDAGKVSDFMFQLVRKGVGSYDEFAKAIGRAIPSARRAGQSYQTLGGMMAFLTRNGLSTAMAATSSARALDALSHPATIERLDKMGVKVRDMNGEFLPLTEILGGLNKEFGDLTAPKRAKALQELFAGSGGTIQARRFFDNYFRNADEFVKRTKEMDDATGEAGKAFKTMSESSGAKLQQFKNDWALLRIEIGERLMPTAMKIVDFFGDMIDKWNKLDEGTKNNIVTLAAVSTALLAVLGVLIVIGGALVFAAGGFRMLGTSIGVVGSKAGRAMVGVGLLIGGVKSLRDESSEAHKTVGFLSTVAGGAAIGSIFGPWGAVIGGAAGAIGGLAAATRRSAVEFVKATDDAKQYMATLNQLTGATTKATREMAYDTLMKDKNSRSLVRGAVAAGAASRDIISAALGEKDAQQRLNVLFKERTNLYRKAKEAYGKDDPRVDRLREEAGALHLLNSYLQEEAGNIAKAAKRVREKAAAVKTWNKELKSLPKKVQTELKQMGYKPNAKELDKLKNKYKDLTKKDWEIIMKLKDVKEVIKNSDDVKKGLEDVKKVKPNLTGWKKGLLDAVREGKQAAERGGKAVQKALEKALGNARADLSYYKKSVSTGITEAKRLASTGGNGVGSALKTGVLVGMSGLADTLSAQVAAAVNVAIAAGKAAAKAKSPSRRMMELGKDLSDGLTIGLRENAKKDEPKHKNTLTKIFRRVMNHILKEWRAGTLKLADILDEARPLIKKKLDRMAKGLKDDALKAFNKTRGKKTKGMLDNIVKATEGELKKLDKLGKRYKSVLKRLEAARDKLRNLRQERKAYIDSVKSSLRDYAFTFEKPTDVFGNEEDWTVGGISNQLKEKLAQIKEFGSLLKKVKKRFPGLYEWIVAMGPVDGSAFAAALLQATDAEAAGINSMVGEINSQSAMIAEAAGNTMYNAGIKAAEGLVKGLESKKKELEKIAKILGEAIAKAIKKALGIKSPSSVGIKIGQNFGGALAAGLRSQQKSVSRAAIVLAKASELDLSDPNSTYGKTPVVGARYTGPVAGSAGAGNGGKTIKQEITVNTQEIDPRRHAAQLGWELATNHRI